MLLPLRNRNLELGNGFSIYQTEIDVGGGCDKGGRDGFNRGGGGVSKATPEYFAHTCEPGPTIV